MADALGGIQVAEVLHYFSDYDTAREFYAGKLGWPVHFDAKGELLILDVRGHYQLGLINSRWTPGWSKGQPVPSPQLSIECRDLRRVYSTLKAQGCNVSEVGGDPSSMLTLELTDPWDNRVFFWQDASGAGSTGVEHQPFDAAEQLHGVQRDGSPYGFAETLYFVANLAAAEAWYCKHLGFETSVRHGHAYAALQLAQGRTLGLLNWADWFDKPDENTPPAAPRLSLMVFEIAAEHERLKAAGVQVGELKDSGEGLRWFTFADPDGTLISFWRFEQPE
jgi:catechol 2,3-dioxygenase-like lactoylglutathione lyase family enzyme